MTAKESSEPHAVDRPAAEADDQKAYPFSYDHGRMPFFMKIAWVVFLVLATWYVVSYLLTALGRELSG